MAKPQPAKNRRAEALDDLHLIEPLLWGLWAPQDVDPKRRAELINDATADHLTVNDVIRARRAFERLRMYVQAQI